MENSRIKHNAWLTVIYNGGNHSITLPMLSYRHAFHAGNHADVLKHFVLQQVLNYSNQKDKPYWYIDTHAGAGMYALDHGYATQNAEFAEGISRLWNEPALPPALAEFVDQIRQHNRSSELRYYPGSPSIAQDLVRPDDRLRLFELHPNDAKLLRQHFKSAGRKAIVEQEDGFTGIKAMLPPPTRRAVVLIDPPYEEKRDYQRVVESLKDSLLRFATGTYIIWYPLLQRVEVKQMLDKLAKLQLKSWLNVSFTAHTPSPEGFGMHGSGLFIVNPPWTLPGTLQEVMPVLVEKLQQDSGASYHLEYQIP